MALVFVALAAMLLLLAGAGASAALLRVLLEAAAEVAAHDGEAPRGAANDRAHDNGRAPRCCTCCQQVLLTLLALQEGGGHGGLPAVWRRCAVGSPVSAS